MPLYQILTIYIWPVTMYVGIVSTSIFFLIIITRFINDRKENIKEQRKEELRNILLTHIHNPLKDLKRILLKEKKDLDFIAELAPELLHNLKGDSYQLLLKSLKDLGLYNWLRRSFISNNKTRRLSAVLLSFHWPDELIKNHLKHLLKDSQLPIRRATLEALASTKDTKLFPLIILTLKNNKDFSYPLICDVFQKFGPDIANYLVTITQHKTVSLNLKMAALMALGETNDIENINKAALPLCKDSQNTLRALAFHVISKSKKVIPDDILKQGTQDTYWQVRLYAAECAANSIPIPFQILKDLLQDENWLVGLQAAKVLFDANESGKKILYITSKHKDTIAGQRAEMILAEKGASHEMA